MCHSTIFNDKIPKIGIRFDSDDVAYSFYNEYAKSIGIRNRRHIARRDLTGKVLDRIYLCLCECQMKHDKRCDC